MNSKYTRLPEWDWIIEPTLLLNSKVAKANIQRMAAKARRLGLRFRPHFKTHQSREVGEWFRDAGVAAITVSSIEMARYFADAGWQDIMIAFPINVRDIAHVNDLAQTIDLGVLISDLQTIQILDAGLQAPVAAWIEVDVGDGRSGFAWDHAKDVVTAATAIEETENLRLAGLLGHAGHLYRSRGITEIQSNHAVAVEKLRVATSALEAGGWKDFLVSTGDTPSCSRAEDFAGEDEIRPGNFVFYDLMQVQIGSCDVQDIAVALACPVVAVYPERNEVILHGGGVHFSKDSLLDAELGPIFGKVCLPQPHGWGAPEPGCYLRSISQEHGVAIVRPDLIGAIQVGDLLAVLPVHSCMTADLMTMMYAIDCADFSRPIPMMKAER
jgi:D-serine deaminase-like pyridoxal phosphate-dependent protein